MGRARLTTPEQQLRELARLTGETACLLHERDGRFRPEDAPALERALHSVAAEGQTGWDEELSFRAWRRDLEAAMRRAAELRGDMLVELEREPDLSGRAPASRSRAQASASR